jgi:hypothetical protein
MLFFEDRRVAMDNELKEQCQKLIARILHLRGSL